MKNPLIKAEVTREILYEMHRLKTLIQQSIRSAQQKYLSWANRRTIKRKFEVRDEVFVRVKAKGSTLSIYPW
jgi:hypothetical protein